MTNISIALDAIFWHSFHAFSFFVHQPWFTSVSEVKVAPSLIGSLKAQCIISANLHAKNMAGQNFGISPIRMATEGKRKWSYMKKVSSDLLVQGSRSN